MDKYVKDSDIYDIVMSQFCASSDETEAALNAIIEGTRALPPADVRPVVKAVWKHVRWVRDDDEQEGGYWISRCSNCSMPYHTETPFCPHCGADMREKS